MIGKRPETDDGNWVRGRRRGYDEFVTGKKTHPSSNCPDPMSVKYALVCLTRSRNFREVILQDREVNVVQIRVKQLRLLHCFTYPYNVGRTPFSSLWSWRTIWLWLYINLTRSILVLRITRFSPFPSVLPHK